jgi:hypothetical protein
MTPRSPSAGCYGFVNNVVRGVEFPVSNPIPGDFRKRVQSLTVMLVVFVVECDEGS